MSTFSREVSESSQQLRLCLESENRAPILLMYIPGSIVVLGVKE